MGRDGNGEGGGTETWIILLPLFQALADYVLRFYFIQVIFQQFSTIRGRVLGGGLVGSQLLADIITGKLLILMLFNHMYSVKLFSSLWQFFSSSQHAACCVFVCSKKIKLLLRISGPLWRKTSVYKYWRFTQANMTSSQVYKLSEKTRN